MTPQAYLRLVCCIDYLSILDIYVKNEVGKHGELRVKLLVEYEKSDNMPERVRGTNVSLFDVEDRPIFSGVCVEADVFEAAEYRELDITVATYSIQADVDMELNTYQSMSKSFLGLFRETYSEYGAYIGIDEDVKIPFTLSQENETDWKFLKRIAAQYGKEIFVNPRADVMSIFVGEPNVAGRSVPWRLIGIHKDVNAMRTDIAALGIVASAAEYEVLDVETEVLNICPGDLINGYRVVENYIFSDGGLMVNRLGLQYNGKVHANALESHNHELESQILTGIVEKVDDNLIQVSYPSDKGSGSKPWIPYESAISNSFYCMPDEGNEVYIYYDNTGQSVCLGSKRTDTSHPNFDVPADKSMSFMGSVIKLATDKILIEKSGGSGEGQSSRITMSENGLDIYSDTGINITATGKVGILASTDAVFSEMDSAIDKCEKMHEAGALLHAEHGGRSTWDKIGLNIKSGWKKTLENNKKSLESLLFLDVFKNTRDGYSALINYFSKNPLEEVEGEVETYVEINSLGELVLRVSQENQILLNVNINITAKQFEWLGTDIFDNYKEQSVSDSSWIDSLLDTVQLGLDICGLIPGFGAVPDLINAGISLLRGDFVNAGVNLLSAIPLLGDAVQAGKIVGKTAKVITKVDNALDAIKSIKILQKIEKIRNIAEQIATIPQTVSQLQEIWTREGTPLWQDIWDTAIAVGEFTVDIIDKKLDKKRQNDSEGNDTPQGDSTRTNESGSGGSSDSEGTRLGGGGNDTPGGDSQSNSSRTEDTVGDPVNMVTGSLKIAHTDMKYNDIMDVFPLVRTYESVYTNEGHMLGNRWIYNLESRMYIFEDKITIRMQDNHLEHFVPEGINWRNKREGDTLYSLLKDSNGYILYNKQNRKTYFYNEEGFLETISDRNNNYTYFSYLGNQLTKVVLASGISLDFAYEGNKLKSVTDSINREISYEYDGELLTKVYYPNGAMVKYEYDTNGNLISAWDENGQKYVTSQYDRKGRVLRQVMADGEEYVYFYDDANKVNTFLTMSTGNSVKYEYNRNNLVTAIVYQDQTREEKEYDAGDNLIRYKDRMGNVSTYTYDSAGNLLQRVLPNGLTLTCTYDENNYLVHSIDNVGRESRFVYDANYNLISNIVKMDEGVFIEKTYEYDDTGRVVASVDGNGNKTTYFYESNFARPTCVTLADGTQKTYTYDAAGRKMSEDNGKSVLKYAYNQFDCVTSIMDEEGNTTKFVYDLACKLTKIIRPKEYRENALQGAGIEYKYDALQRLVSTTNPCGEVHAVQVNGAGATTKEIHPNAYVKHGENGIGIENIYDTFGNLTHVKYPEGGTRRMIYNANGQCIKDIGPAEYMELTDEGAGYEYEYDSVGRMTQVTDPYGRILKKYVYNLMGSVAKEIDAKGMETGTTDEERIGTLYQYNLCGWLTQKRQPVSYDDGKVGYFLTTYEYDKAGNLITEKRYLDEQSQDSQSGRVNIVHRKYDACGRLVCVSDNQGAEVLYKYDVRGNLVYESRKINDEQQQIRSWSYNKRGKVEQYLQTADFKATRQKAAKVTFAYDENANLIKRTLADGSEITYSYDAAGRVITEQHKEKKGGIAKTLFYEYDCAGNLVTVHDNKGVTTKYEYDFLNRKVKEIGANGATTMYCYGNNGKLEKMITPMDYAAGETTGIRYVYDSCGRMTELLGKNNEVLFSQEFNEYGEVCKQQHAGLMPVTYQYDFGGRRIGSVSGEQRTEHIAYDALGNVKAVTDGNANTTAYEYDTWGRITAIKHADGSGEHYAYDYAGNITQSVDGNGNKVHYTYNEINKLAQITWQDETTEHFAYDISGNLSKQTLRDGRSIHYTYNMYQSLTSRRSGDGTVEESYFYDEDGRLKSAIAGGMRYEYVYNPDGSLREKCASGRTLIAYEYDLNGNVVKQKDVSGKIVSYTYDNYNRINKVFDSSRLLAEYDYTAFGMKKSVRVPGITDSCYEYDGDANLTLHKVTSQAAVLSDNHYQYDGNGNMTVKSGIYGEYRYTYDELNRLTEEVFARGQEGTIAPDSYVTRFAYDKAGNRVSMEQGGSSYFYTYDNCNRLIKEQSDDTLKDYTYDVCGNLKTDGSNTYSYDELNRLSTVTTADGHVQRNHYDAEGLRHELEEDGRLVQFIYNRSGQVITEESGEEGLIRYVRGLGLISSDSEQAKTYYHYVSDHVGSTTHVLNEQSSVENEYLYDAFGNITASRENASNRFCYTGEQYDRIPNQYYLRARYYNPVIGRFTQQDTYLGAGLNLYAYCAGNPLSYVDPSGHDHESIGNNSGYPQDPNALENPNIQAWMDRCIASRMNYIQEGADAGVNHAQEGVNAMTAQVYGSSSSSAAPVQSAGNLSTINSGPQSPGNGGDSAPSTELTVTAPFGTYLPVPYSNGANSRPLDARQRGDVADAVNGAGGSSESGSNTVKNGATRAAQFSSEWGNASLNEAINKFAPNVEPVITSKGKVIYNNPETGISVVYDKNGNYFRIEDTTRPRGRNYLDINGNDMNNETVNGKIRGRSRADYQRVTHFNNSDE